MHFPRKNALMNRVQREFTRTLRKDVTASFWLQKERQKFNFTTDKYAGYKKGHTHYFYNVATLTHGVPIKCKKYGLKKTTMLLNETINIAEN